MKQSEIDRQKAKAAVQFKIKKSFIGRNLYLFYGVCAVYGAAALWSMATASGNIYIRLSEMWGENIFALICAGVAGFCIIGLQFVSGKGAVDDLQIGIMKKKADGENLYPAAEQAFFFLKVAGFFAMSAVSITLSINGVGKANDWFRNTKNPPTMAAADVSYYDQQLDRIAGQIKQEQTRKWKGVLTTDASRRIKEYEQESAKIRAQRVSVIEKVDAENAIALERYDTGTAQNSRALKGVGGVAEIVVLFCILFIGLYDDGLYREANAKGATGAMTGATNGPAIGFRPPPVFAENAQQETPKMCSPVAQKDTALLRFSSPELLRNTEPEKPREAIGFTRQTVAPAQQKAQQRKRNTSATKNPAYLSARSAIRNARTAIKKAQQDYEINAIDADQLAATIATKQAAITRNERRAAELKNRKP